MILDSHTNGEYLILKTVMWNVDPSLTNNWIEGFVPQTKEDFSKFYKIDILENHNFGVRRPL